MFARMVYVEAIPRLHADLLVTADAFPAASRFPEGLASRIISLLEGMQVTHINKDDMPKAKQAAVLASMGLSFLWPCMGSSATMHFRHAMSCSASAIGTQWHAVVMSVFYLLATAALALFCKRAAEAFSSRYLDSVGFVAGLIGFVGHAVLVVTSGVADVSLATVLTLVGFALTVACIVALVLAWFFLLARLPFSRVLCILAASSAISYALQLTFDLALGTGMLSFLVTCPLLCGICLCAAARYAGPSCEEEVAPNLLQGIKSMPWPRIAAIVALIYLEQAFTSLLFQRYSDWPRDNLTITLGGGLAIWLLAWLIVRRRMGEGPMGGRAVHVALFAFLLVVYMAALLATVVLPQGEAPIAERFLVCAGSSFRILLWMVLCASVAQSGVSACGAGLVYVVLVLAVPVSRLAALVFSGMDASALAVVCSPSVVIPLAAAILFAVAGGFVVANTRSMQRLMEELSGAAASTEETAPQVERARSCARLVSEACLTPREAEVLELMCAGYSARHAGERLGISESTVVSHVSHIYRKTGVSSRQQLLALVDADMGGPHVV